MNYYNVRLISVIALSMLISSCFPVFRTAHPNIYGTVIDLADQKPIAGVVVTYASFDNQIAITDTLGQYKFAGNNFFEFTILGEDAPPTFVRLLAQKPGYFDYEDSYGSKYGGANPNVTIQTQIKMISKSHPIAPYVLQLKSCIDQDAEYADWLAIFKKMKSDGFSREDAKMIIRNIPEIFNSLGRNEEKIKKYYLLNNSLYSDTIWALP